MAGSQVRGSRRLYFLTVCLWSITPSRARIYLLVWRFISPAIVAPETIDIEVPKDPVLRRGLMVIAKIIQNLANNIFFGKEPHMIILNDFLRNNIVNVTLFLTEIIVSAFSGRFYVIANILVLEIPHSWSR